MALALWFAGLVGLMIAAAVASGRGRATPNDVASRGVIATAAVGYAAVVAGAVWLWGGATAREGRLDRIREGAIVAVTIDSVRVPLSAASTIGHAATASVRVPGSGPDTLVRVELDAAGGVTLHAGDAVLAPVRAGEEPAAVARARGCAADAGAYTLPESAAVLVLECDDGKPVRALVVRRAHDAALAITPLGVAHGSLAGERRMLRAGDALRLGGAADAIPGLVTWDVVSGPDAAAMLAIPIDPVECASWTQDAGARASDSSCAVTAGAFSLVATPVVPDADAVVEHGIETAVLIGSPPLLLLCGLLAAPRRGRRARVLGRALRACALAAGLTALVCWRLLWAHRIDVLREAGTRVADNRFAAIAIGAALAGCAVLALDRLEGRSLVRRVAAALTAWAVWLAGGALVVGATLPVTTTTVGVLGLSAIAALAPVLGELVARASRRVPAEVVLVAIAVAAVVARAGGTRGALAKLGLAYATVLAGHAALRAMLVHDTSWARRARLAVALVGAAGTVAMLDAGVALAIVGVGLALAMLVAGHDAMYDASQAGKIGVLEREHARLLVVHGAATAALAIAVAAAVVVANDRTLLEYGALAVLHAPLVAAGMFALAAGVARSHRRSWAPWLAAALAALAVWGARDLILERVTDGSGVGARRVAAVVEPGYALLRDDHAFVANATAWREAALAPSETVDPWHGQGYFGARVRDPGVSRSIDNDYLPVLVAREGGVAGLMQGVMLLLVLVVGGAAIASVRLRHASREHRARWLVTAVAGALAVYQPLAALGVLPLTGISWPGFGIDSPADIWLFVIGAAWCFLGGDGASDDERVRGTPRLVRARRIVLGALVLAGLTSVVIVARAGACALVRAADDDTRVVTALHYASTLECATPEHTGATLDDALSPVIAGKPADNATARFERELHALWKTQRAALVGAFTKAPATSAIDAPIEAPVDTPADTPIDTPIDTPVIRTSMLQHAALAPDGTARLIFVTDPGPIDPAATTARPTADDKKPADRGPTGNADDKKTATRNSADDAQPANSADDAKARDKPTVKRDAANAGVKKTARRGSADAKAPDKQTASSDRKADDKQTGSSDRKADDKQTASSGRKADDKQTASSDRKSGDKSASSDRKPGDKSAASRRKLDDKQTASLSRKAGGEKTKTGSRRASDDDRASADSKSDDSKSDDSATGDSKVDDARGDETPPVPMPCPAKVGAWRLQRDGAACVATLSAGWPEVKVALRRSADGVQARCSVALPDDAVSALRATSHEPRQRIRVVSAPIGASIDDAGEVAIGSRIVRLRAGAPERELSALPPGLHVAGKLAIHTTTLEVRATPRGVVLRGPAELFVAEGTSWRRTSHAPEVVLDRLTLIAASSTAPSASGQAPSAGRRAIVLFRPPRAWAGAAPVVDTLLADTAGDRTHRIYPHGAALPELGWVNPYAVERSLGLDGWIHAAQTHVADKPACGTFAPPAIARDRVCTPSPLDGVLECRVALQPQLALALRELADKLLAEPKPFTGRETHPVRVAYVALRGDTGEVLAQGNVVPGRPALAFAPTDATAEAELVRLRGEPGEADSERVEWNLPIAVGSTFKPIVARAAEQAFGQQAASLTLTAAGHASGCRRRRGNAVDPIAGHCPPTSVAGQPTTADLHEFLARSPNWFMAALGVLGLGMPDAQLTVKDARVSLADVVGSDLASWPADSPLVIADAHGPILGKRGLSIDGMRRTPLWTRVEALLGRPICTLGDRASCERAAARADVCAARALPIAAPGPDLRNLVALGPDRIDPYADDRAHQASVPVREYFQLLRGSGLHAIGSLAQITDAFGRVVYDPGPTPTLAASWFPAPAVGVVPGWSCATIAARANTVLGAGGGLCGVVQPGGTAVAALKELLADKDIIVYGAKSGTIDSLADIARNPSACRRWNAAHVTAAKLECGRVPPDDSLFVIAFGVVTPKGTIPITLGIQLQRAGKAAASKATPAFVHAIAQYLRG